MSLGGVSLSDHPGISLLFVLVFLHHYFSTDIPFENEEQLRDRGTSRTPDVLLSTPLGIEVPKKNGNGAEWKIICWIDSKVRGRLDRLICSFRLHFVTHPAFAMF